MTPAAAIAEAKANKLRLVYLLVGEESFLADQVLAALRAAVDTGPPGFNDDKFQAGESKIERIIDGLRTMPMMARQRLVVVSGVERWERKGEGAGERCPRCAGSLLRGAAGQRAVGAGGA